MTLTSSLNSALSGLKTYQEVLSVHSHNVANANTEGYVKQSATQSSVVTDGRGQGVQIESVLAEIDARVNANIRQQNTSLGRTEVLQDYLSSAEELYGTPNSAGSLSTLFNDFFLASISALIPSLIPITLSLSVI